MAVGCRFRSVSQVSLLQSVVFSVSLHAFGSAEMAWLLLIFRTGREPRSVLWRAESTAVRSPAYVRANWGRVRIIGFVG